MCTGGLILFIGRPNLRTLDQDSASPSIAVRHKAIVHLGSEHPFPVAIPARQSSQAAFTCLAVGILRRASAEVRTRRTSVADTACSEGTPAVILAAIPTVITTRAKGHQPQIPLMQPQSLGVPRILVARRRQRCGIVHSPAPSLQLILPPHCGMPIHRSWLFLFAWSFIVGAAGSRRKARNNKSRSAAE